MATEYASNAVKMNNYVNNLMHSDEKINKKKYNRN